MSIPRRRILIAGAAAAAFTAVRPPLSQAAPDAETDLAALEQRYNAKVGLHGRNLDSGRTLDHNADELFATCSAFKAYVAGAILRMDQRGELKLSDEVYIDRALFVPVASPVTEPNIGGWMPLSQLCAAAVRQSDNTATNLMLEILGGPTAITEFARSVGDERTWMVRREPELNTAYPGDPRDTSSPRAIGTGFANMLLGDVLDESHRAQLYEWMSTIVTGDNRIRAGMPPGWTVADKTGSGDYASTNDIGVAFGPDGGRLLLAVMTRTRSDDPKAPALNDLIAEVTRMAVPRLLG
ncbi:MAG: class A beta-lactamase [Mycobacterium sp.]